MPTILDYLRISVPEQCQGKSLKPIIEGKVDAVNEFVFAEYTGGAAPDTFTVRSTRYKLCREAEKNLFAYDLIRDPDERNRIYLDDFPASVRYLHEALEEYMAKYVEGKK